MLPEKRTHKKMIKNRFIFNLKFNYWAGEVCYNLKTIKGKNYKLLHIFVDNYVHNRKDRFYIIFFSDFHHWVGLELP